MFTPVSRRKHGRCVLRRRQVAPRVRSRADSKEADHQGARSASVRVPCSTSTTRRRSVIADGANLQEPRRPPATTGLRRHETTRPRPVSCARCDRCAERMDRDILAVVNIRCHCLLCSPRPGIAILADPRTRGLNIGQRISERGIYRWSVIRRTEYMHSSLAPVSDNRRRGILARASHDLGLRRARGI